MRRVILTAILVLLLPTMLLAQAQITGSIAGTVTGENGPIAGATVTATSIDSGLERETKTDRNGNYYLGLLKVGNWSVVITAPGMQPQVTSFRIGLGERVPVDAMLMPGEVVSEEVNVYSTATAMQTSGTQENIDYRKEVEELPIDDRRLNAVAQLAGHVSDVGGSSATLSVAIAGAPGMDTTVLLDGAEISDPLFGGGVTVYLEDAVEELQVLTSGISARYGRFQGGVINAITKSGSNEFEATLRYEIDNDSWNEATPFGETLVDADNETYQLTAGGYFWKDRAWWFGGYREIPATGTSGVSEFSRETITQNITEERWQAKLRGAPLSNHIIDISHLEFEAASTGAPFAQVIAPATKAVHDAGARLDPRETETISYQGVLTDSLFLEAQATTKDVGIASGGDPSSGLSPVLDWNTLDVFNNWWWDQSDADNRSNETMSANVTYSLATASAGTHTIEFGGAAVDSITGGQNKQSPTDYNIIGYNANFVASTSGEPLFNLLPGGNATRWKSLAQSGGQTIENLGLYANDTINIGDFRFDVGFRYDDYQGAGNLARFNVGFDKIVPRLGMAYNLTDVWQVTASLGRYTARFNDNFAQGTSGVGNAGSIDQFYTGPAMFGITGPAISALAADDSLWTQLYAFSGPGTPNEYLADNINAPYSEELSLSLRRALPNNTGTVVLSYVNRDYQDLVTDYVGDVCSFTHFTFSHFTQSCPAANTTEVLDENGMGTGSFSDTTVWANDPLSIREYQGISLQGNYSPSARWNVGGSYTFSETQGNYEGEGTNTPASGGVNGNYVRSKNILLAAPFGFLDEDIRHRSRIFGTYRLPFGRAGNLSLSGIYARQSGQRYSLQASTPHANDPVYLGDGGTYTAYLSQRGQFRFNDFQRFDFSARYDVDLVAGLGLFVKAAVINLFNFDELLTFDTVGAAVSNGSAINFVPTGNCGLTSTPSKNCTGYGKIASEADYQRPREFFFTLGLRY